MEDGFEIPFLISELVPIRTQLILNTSNENINLFEQNKTDESLYFVIEPDHSEPDLVSDYTLYLFNSSSYNVMYNYNVMDGDHYQSVKQGELGAAQKVILKKINLSFLKEFSVHQMDCIFFKTNYFLPQVPISHKMKIDDRIIAQTKSLTHQDFKFPIYAFLLKESFDGTSKIISEIASPQIENLKMVKEFSHSSSISKPSAKAIVREIDLHIEELVQHPGSMANYQKLNIQLARVEKELDDALVNNVKKIIFIHGVGNGRLKQEIISILKQMDGLTFHDASFKEYGYGATQVNFK
jgi:hypothetical protein